MQQEALSQRKQEALSPEVEEQLVRYIAFGQHRGKQGHRKVTIQTQKESDRISELERRGLLCVDKQEIDPTRPDWPRDVAHVHLLPVWEVAITQAGRRLLTQRQKGRQQAARELIAQLERERAERGEAYEVRGPITRAELIGPASRTGPGAEAQRRQLEQPPNDDKLADALLLLHEHPGLSNARLAKKVGVDPGTLSRWPKFRHAVEALSRQGRRELPKGWKAQGTPA